MGYTTQFHGYFQIDKKLDDDTFNLINGLAKTRRMKRQGLDPKYGEDGEFFFDPADFENNGQTPTEDIVHYNEPPSTQPSMWLKWIVEDDRQTITWSGGEKFYDYVEWIEYLIAKILAPRGYIVNGSVDWFGESRGDTGSIIVEENKVRAVEHEHPDLLQNLLFG